MNICGVIDKFKNFGTDMATLAQKIDNGELEFIFSVINTEIQVSIICKLKESGKFSCYFTVFRLKFNLKKNGEK